MNEANDMLAEVLRACAHPTSVQGVSTSTLKHQWLYIDEVDAPDDGVDDDADPPSYAYGRYHLATGVSEPTGWSMGRPATCCKTVSPSTRNVRLASCGP